jgi:hypothetical protein
MSTLSHALATVEMQIAQVFNAGDVEDAKETLRRCLMATHSKRTGRDESGKIIYEEVPDYPIQLAAGIKILEWSIGRPVSRTIHADATPKAPVEEANAKDELLNMLLAAPEAAQEIIGKLQEAARKAKKAEPVNITATESLPKLPPGSS